MTVRMPAVAGSFYPSHPDTLARQVGSLCGPDQKKKGVVAVVCPHAGYVYSGPVAGAIYSQIEIPETVVIIGPNHRGMGPMVSIMSEGVWKMPNGDVSIHGKLASEILRLSKFVEEDTLGHRQEHSLEVQVPFLQFYRKELKIVPITMRAFEFAYCLDVGSAVARAVRNLGERVLIVASTDMSHYEPEKTAKAMDRKAIDRILAMDPKGLVDTVVQYQISMCGVFPTAAVLIAAKDLGATRAQLVKYATSGDVSGDYDQVVGYAGLILSE